jgi:hypothetical protein
MYFRPEKQFYLKNYILLDILDLLELFTLVLNIICTIVKLKVTVFHKSRIVRYIF